MEKRHEVKIGDLVEFRCYSNPEWENSFKDKNPGLVIDLIQTSGTLGRRRAKVLWANQMMSTEYVDFVFPIY